MNVSTVIVIFFVPFGVNIKQVYVQQMYFVKGLYYTVHTRNSQSNVCHISFILINKLKKEN